MLHIELVDVLHLRAAGRVNAKANHIGPGRRHNQAQEGRDDRHFLREDALGFLVAFFIFGRAGQR